MFFAPLLVHSSAYLLKVCAYRGWQRVLWDHVRRTEWHNLGEPLIFIFSTLDWARVNCDSPDEWEKAGKPMEVQYYLHRD